MKTRLRKYALSANSKKADTEEYTVIADNINTAVKLFTKLLCRAAEEESDEWEQEDGYEYNLFCQPLETAVEFVSDSAGRISVKNCLEKLAPLYMVTLKSSGYSPIKRVKRTDGAKVYISFYDLCSQLGFDSVPDTIRVTNRGTITYNKAFVDTENTSILWSLLTSIASQSYVPAQSLLDALELKF